MKNWIQKLFLFIITLSAYSCVENSTDNFDNEIGEIRNGIWRAVFEPNDSIKVPVLFGITNDGENVFFEIINNNESTFRSILKVENDSFFISLPFYQSQLEVKYSQNKMVGKWISFNGNKQTVIPFSANQDFKGKFISLRPIKHKKSEIWKLNTFERDDFIGWMKLSQNDEKVSLQINTPLYNYQNLEGNNEKRRQYYSYFNGQNLIYVEAKKINEAEMTLEIFDFPSSSIKKFKAKKQSGGNIKSGNVSYQNESAKSILKQELIKNGISNISEYKNIVITGTWNLKGENMWKSYISSGVGEDTLTKKSLA